MHVRRLLEGEGGDGWGVNVGVSRRLEGNSLGTTQGGLTRELTFSHVCRMKTKVPQLPSFTTLQTNFIRYIFSAISPDMNTNWSGAYEMADIP